MAIQRKSIKNTLIFLVVFSIAMGFMEAVVVVYLRQLYYPDGFSFPLKLITLQGLSLEYWREISTIVMLLAVSHVSGKNFYERLSYLLICFGIWDIFYYVWLKVLLNWPASFFTWDVLFLIPVVWAGPVLAPIICALTIIIFGGCMIHFQQKGYPAKMNLSEWVLLSAGALIIFLTFIWEYMNLIIKGGFISHLFTLKKDPEFLAIVAQHIPQYYQWPFFVIGEILMLCSLLLFCRRNRSFKY